MAEAIPPTNPTPVTTGLLGTASEPNPTTLGGTTVNIGGGANELHDAINGLGAYAGQGALDGSGQHRGNTYVVPAGVTYSRVIIPPTTHAGWTRIRSGSASLPPRGVTFDPASHAASIFTIEANPTNEEHALHFAGNPGYTTQGWHFIGVGARPGSNTTEHHALVHLDPTHETVQGVKTLSTNRRIIFERVYFRPFSPTQLNMCRALWVQDCEDFQVWDSFLESRVIGAGITDAQALAARSGARHHVEHNFLQASSENMMIGDQGDSRPCVDVTIRRNTFFKPLAWKRFLADGSQNPSWDGLLGTNGEPWNVKNLFEIKCGRRVLFEGNLLENCWAAGQDGTGMTIAADPTIQTDLQATADVMVRSNIFKRMPSMFSSQTYQGGAGAGVLKRVALVNNLGLIVAGWFWLFNYTCQDAWMEHNTVVPQDGIHTVQQGASKFTINFNSFGNDTAFWPRATIRRNVFGHSEFGLRHEQSGGMSTAIANAHIPDRDFAENVVVNGQGDNVTAGFANLGSHASLGIDPATGTLAMGSSLRVGGTYGGSDGQGLGVNFAALDAAMGPPAGPTAPVADFTYAPIPSTPALQFTDTSA